MHKSLSHSHTAPPFLFFFFFLSPSFSFVWFYSLIVICVESHNFRSSYFSNDLWLHRLNLVISCKENEIQTFNQNNRSEAKQNEWRLEKFSSRYRKSSCFFYVSCFSLSLPFGKRAKPLKESTEISTSLFRYFVRASMYLFRFGHGVCVVAYASRT